MKFLPADSNMQLKSRTVAPVCQLLDEDWSGVFHLCTLCVCQRSLLVCSADVFEHLLHATILDVGILDNQNICLHELYSPVGERDVYQVIKPKTL